MRKAADQEEHLTQTAYKTVCVSSKCKWARTIEEEGKQQEVTPLPLSDPDLMGHVFKFITEHKDRNAVSLVCKAWNAVEASGRQRIYVGNCYAVSAERVSKRFTRFKSLTLKGKPRFADFDLVPRNWGAFVLPWIRTLSSSHPFLEELRLKRMTLSDECLKLIAMSFPQFKSLVLTSCDGFSTDGLAYIAAQCRHLVHLELTENNLNNKTGAWLRAFPSGFTSLVSLSFEDIDHEDMDFDALEGLISRCRNLKTLKLNRNVSLAQLQRVLVRCPQLLELGTGSFSPGLSREEQSSLCDSFQKCTQLRTLSGFWVVTPGHLPAIYTVCSNLVSLNLSYAPICDGELADLVAHCPNIQKLWLMDTVEDKGLEAVALSCKNLRDFRVYPISTRLGQGVTEDGLMHIARGCVKLQAILYFCNQMTNSAVEVMAKNCLNLVSFRLCIMEPAKPDHMTNAPMDEGFGAIVQQCKSLRRLSLSGWLTDKAFEYIGTHAKKLERLSVAFAGESDVGLQYVLRGCTNLKKLEIRDSPFGDMALLSGLHRYESMRSLWMSNCSVTITGCQWLAQHKPRLNVEVIQKNDKDNNANALVESVYVYRSVAGHREDRPPFVMAL
ncbi:hypothetical protein KP509_01G096900 [Ceratopteris richardii]|uniref:F-box domain-containing protein n=1 Tax=Ceratopteris richardii TaxID=49495 RepID=A0A8T2VM42_CERRI|nr:hypothetical protein KP509_01G096900 [Ceratopteris richardii]